MASVAPRGAAEAVVLQPPRVGLLASAPSREGAGRWETGLEYEPEGCGVDVGLIDPCTGGQVLIDGGNADIEKMDPFLIWAGRQCTTLNFQAAEYEARATRLLLACQSKQVEAEFWSGALTQAAHPADENFYLNETGAATLVNTTPSTPVEALALLEQGLADCGCGARGMIHATRSVVTLWSEGGLVQRQGSLLVTIHDTIVVPGAGYDGSGPGNEAAADGSVFAYATGLVNVRLSPVDVTPKTFAEATDRTLNTVAFRAHRTAAFLRDTCCHLAVEVDAPIPAVVGS